MDEYWITEAMIRMGGSFVKELGLLYRLADKENQKLIRTTWNEYWCTYTANAYTFKSTWEKE